MNQVDEYTVSTHLRDPSTGALIVATFRRTSGSTIKLLIGQDRLIYGWVIIGFKDGRLTITSTGADWTETRLLDQVYEVVDDRVARQAGSSGSGESEEH